MPLDGTSQRWTRNGIISASRGLSIIFQRIAVQTWSPISSALLDNKYSRKLLRKSFIEYLYSNFFQKHDYANIYTKNLVVWWFDLGTTPSKPLTITAVAQVFPTRFYLVRYVKLSNYVTLYIEIRLFFFRIRFSEMQFDFIFLL